MMLPKLALGNVRRSIRDYTVYFITITFAVCVFYIFNSLESQQVMMETSPGQQAALDLLGKLMSALSVFISAALCFLIIYANGFLIKRRKKEFGIYLVLGMEKGAISWILVMETVLVGVAGLLVGLLMGVFVSQGMALVTARLLNSTVGAYHFVFSPAAAVGTTLYFGLTFLFTLAFNIVVINRQRLIDLLIGARKNESLTPPRLPRSVALFILALGLLGGAYYLIGRETLFADSAVLIGAVLLLIAGTFLFFFSLSGFFLKLVQQRKGLYLRNLNMFVLRQVNSRIHTNYVSMTFVCLMLTLAICALSSGTGVANVVTANQRANAPFDATVVFQQSRGDVGAGEGEGEGEDEGDGSGEEGLVPYTRLDVERALREQGIDLAHIASRWSTLTLYQSPTSLAIRTLPSEQEGAPTQVTVPTRVIRLSDYNALLAAQGQEPITLGLSSFAVHVNRPSAERARVLTAYLEESPSIDFNGATLTAEPSALLTTMDQSTATRVEDVKLVVPDRYVERDGELLLPAVRTLLNIDYLDYRAATGDAAGAGDGDGADGAAGTDGAADTGDAAAPAATGTDGVVAPAPTGAGDTAAGGTAAPAATTDGTAALDAALERLFEDCVVQSDDGVSLGALVTTRSEVLQLGSSATTIVAYIALYLGMVFLLASAALLAIAQLSEVSDNVSRYRLLAKIGTEAKLLRGAVLSQVAIYFGAPLLLALAHSVVGVSALRTMLVTLKGEDILGGALVASLVVLAIYGGYFLATYTGGRGILNREVLHRLVER